MLIWLHFPLQMRPNTATTLAAPPRRAPGTKFNTFVETISHQLILNNYNIQEK